MKNKNCNNVEVKEIETSSNEITQWLETILSALIEKEGSWLWDLAKFSKNLTKNKAEQVLTQHNLDSIKQDLQNWWLIDFEPGIRNDKPFWFEVIGNDIEPTLTPNWDCIIPINFWYDSQRRTKLLILHIQDNKWDNIYSIPNWDNEYPIEIWKESWLYCLHQDDRWFHLIIKN